MRRKLNVGINEIFLKIVSF